ncbi:MAG: ATP-binding region ATPase domain protein [Gemmatimonadetes bacterium]|nr:ATP-binding region ATPase domain protein [Gemmatimonadota bacterium]
MTDSRAWRYVLVVAPALLCMLLSLFVYNGVRRTRESRLLVAHTRDVRQRATITLSRLQDAETGQRGFLLTGEERYLAPYERALAALTGDTSLLRSLTADNAQQQARLDTLRGFMQLKLEELASTIAARRASGLDSAMRIVRTDRGIVAMDSIRAVTGRVIAEESSLLDRRLATEVRRGRAVTLILFTGTLLAVILAILVNATLLRHAEAEEQLAAELDLRNQHLEEQAVELELQSHQLQDQAAELEMQNEELTSASDELTERTHDAEVANAAADEARVAAEDANRAKSEFLAVMSHELRTPLNAIAGYTQLMQLGVPEPVSAAHQEYLTRIQQSQYHLLGIINSVLNFARIEAGTVHYDVTDVAVSPLLASIEGLIGPQLQSRGHRYRCAPCDPSLVVRADADKVVQVLLNLLSNAIKFTAPGGSITLSAVACDGLAQLRVADTGAGIPADKVKSIFAPFVQLDTSKSRVTEGTGLGLAISHDLAIGMGGSLSVESEVGSGSVFTLSLPLAG